VKVIFLGDGIGFVLAGADSTTGVALGAEVLTAVVLTAVGLDEVAFDVLAVFGAEDFEDDCPKEPKDGMENFGLSSFTSFALAGVATTGFFFHAFCFSVR